MKKLFIIAYSLLVASFASAQNMREIWLSMPDSLVPYLNNSLRTELADYVDMKDMKPEVNNLLDDTTRINAETQRQQDCYGVDLVRSGTRKHAKNVRFGME